jgi:ketosteroid isomerase-like protein
MSKHNVELCRRALDAYNARDIGALVAHADPQIEIHSLLVKAEGSVYRGHGGVRRWLQDTTDAWGETRFEPEAFFDVGEQTLAYCMALGRGRRGGAGVALPVAHVARWRAGLLVHLKVYARREDAVGELGVTEAELEPIAP